jgi:hypothetical protein
VNDAEQPTKPLVRREEGITLIRSKYDQLKRDQGRAYAGGNELLGNRSNLGKRYPAYKPFTLNA